MLLIALIVSFKNLLENSRDGVHMDQLEQHGQFVIE